MKKMKTIGIIGGLGPQATMDLERRIHQVSQKLIDQFVNRGYPPLLVGYFRDAPMVLNADGSVPDKLEPHPDLLEIAQYLGQRADFLVIASNTPHFFVDQIEKAANCPILSIVDVAISEVKRRQIKKVGVLAIAETLQHRLYQDPLDALDIPWIVIPDDLIQPLDDAIYAVMEGDAVEKLGQPAIDAVDYLRNNGAKGIILGCTELPFLLGVHTNAPDIINPAWQLAKAAVKRAIK